MRYAKEKPLELPPRSRKSPILILDIGGEGRHVYAWNLNRSPIKTRGSDRGAPIPRLILARADAIPLTDNSVDRVIVERTPLRKQALREIGRVIALDGTIIFHHALPPNLDPHRMAYEILPGRIQQRKILVASVWLQETMFSQDVAVAPP